MLTLPRARTRHFPQFCDASEHPQIQTRQLSGNEALDENVHAHATCCIDQEASGDSLPPMLEGPRNAAWVDPLAGSSNQHIADIDVFALVDELDCNGIPPPAEDVQQNPSQFWCGHPAEAPAEANRTKSKQTLKLEKLRARNRLAQAKYRRRAKVCRINQL